MKMNNSNWQLFLDNHMLARSTGFDRVVHHPTKKGVVIPADTAWETNGNHMNYVGQKEDGSFFAIYTAMWWDIDRALVSEAGENFRSDRPHQCFSCTAWATSEDGIHWVKPDLGLVDGPEGIDWEKHAPYPSPKSMSKKNNLGVPFDVVRDLGQYGNVSDPDKRFVLNVMPENSGPVAMGFQPDGPKIYWAREIPDFLNDPNWRDKLIPFEGALSTRGKNLSFWDDIHEEWVAIVQNCWPRWLPTRQIGRFSTKDFVNWKSLNAMYPDAEDPHDIEHYEEPMTLIPYYAEGVVIGLLSWFHGDKSHPYGGPTLEPGPEHANIWPWCRKGTNELRVTVSRDGGMTWDRTVSRKAWIPHGTEPDADDRCVMWSIPPVRVGDEDWFYVYSANQDHLNTLNNIEQTAYHHSGPSVRHTILYTQKHNRFVSMRARNYPEMLITNPVKVDGDTLQLNVDANRGLVEVGIALADPVPTFEGRVPSVSPHLKDKHLIEGFGFDDCEPIYANSIEHTVKFKNGTGLEAIRGKEVYLLFRMTDSELYGFRFM